jgi:hypothetical protein
LFRLVDFGSPTPWPAFEKIPVVKQAVEPGGNRSAVAEQFPQSATGRLEVNSVLARS